MLEINNSEFLIPIVGADFFLVVFLLVAIILTFRIVLRVEKGLDIYFKLFLYGLIFAFSAIVIRILTSIGIIEGNLLMRIFSLIALCFVLASLVVMNKIVTRMDGEK